MLVRIYIVPNADIPVDLPSQTSQQWEDGAQTGYLVGPEGFADWDVVTNAFICGSWDKANGLQEGESFDGGGNVIGTPTHPVTADYEGWIRPLGNKNGRATGILDSTRWAGDAEQKFLQTDHRYTDSNDPFTLQITRDDNTYPAWSGLTNYANGVKVMHAGTGWQSQQTNNLDHEPGQPGSGPWWLATEFGWGWVAEMTEPSASQDPITGYNIRVYPAPECVPGTQLYTSGNFADIGGGVFQTSATSNNWTPTADQVNIALIFVGGGNSQNGIIILEAGENEVSGEFWSADQ
jgi:hypothetical protein